MVVAVLSSIRIAVMNTVPQVKETLSILMGDTDAGHICEIHSIEEPFRKLVEVYFHIQCQG